MVDMNRDLKLINKIILHCSDSDLPEFDNIETIDKWHRLKGWRKVGYQFYVDQNGKVSEGRRLDEAGAHCSGQNMSSIGICLGGKKCFTESQFRAVWFLVTGLMKQFNLTRKDVYPHHYFNADKTCPNFDLRKIWQYDNESQS